MVLNILEELGDNGDNGNLALGSRRQWCEVGWVRHDNPRRRHLGGGGSFFWQRQQQQNRSSTYNVIVLPHRGPARKIWKIGLLLLLLLVMMMMMMMMVMMMMMMMMMMMETKLALGSARS